MPRAGFTAQLEGCAGSCDVRIRKKECQQLGGQGESDEELRF